GQGATFFSHPESGFIRHQLPPPCRLTRELSGTIQEILGTAQSVGCNVHGHHPYDITDDITSGVVECPAS
ncbi:hypothetical protein E2I00_005529, partial [Balaenoptera physalus]